MSQDAYWERFLTAQDAGLNREAVIAVANKEISLDEALGDMNMDEEVAAMICDGDMVEDFDGLEDGYDFCCAIGESCDDCTPF